MALNESPTPVLCADQWRHRGQSVGPSGGPPPATAVIRREGGDAFTARCDPCVRSLAASGGVHVDAYDLGPPEPPPDTTPTPPPPPGPGPTTSLAPTLNTSDLPPDVPVPPTTATLP